MQLLMQARINSAIAVRLRAQHVHPPGQLQQFGSLVLLGAFCKQHAADEALKPYIGQLSALAKEWGELTLKLAQRIQTNPEELGAAANDYLYYSGYITLADVKQMVLDTVDFQVVDAKSGENLTRTILLQIILE